MALEWYKHQSYLQQNFEIEVTVKGGAANAAALISSMTHTVFAKHLRNRAQADTCIKAFNGCLDT